MSGIRAAAPPRNPDTTPDDAAANQRYKLGDFLRLVAHAPALAP